MLSEHRKTLPKRSHKYFMHTMLFFMQLFMPFFMPETLFFMHGIFSYQPGGQSVRNAASQAELVGPSSGDSSHGLAVHGWGGAVN